MPAVSKAQRRFFGMCEHEGGKNCPKDMSKRQMHDFAATKEKGLPERKRKRTQDRPSTYMGRGR